jgi:hypothetical protein
MNTAILAGTRHRAGSNTCLAGDGGRRTSDTSSSIAAMCGSGRRAPPPMEP